MTSSGHQKNLRAYINDDKKVLLRDSQNMEGCTNPKRWMHHMWLTRESFGHNKASRKVRDKKTGKMREAKNTILYHQILGFNPDECDLNGGKLSSEDCIRYAKEYAETYYPNHQVVMALHNEYCKADKTHRYAVHMVINRSDMATHKRLNEGRGQTAKVERAKRVRSMDEKWNLRQVKEGERNSSIHKKQPSKTERMIEERGSRSYKTNLRELCRIAAEEAENIYDYRELLESWGVETSFEKGRMYVKDPDNNRHSFSVAKLDADLNAKGLDIAFTENVAKSIHAKGAEGLAARKAAQAEAVRIGEMKASYLSDIRKAYRDYREAVRGMEGAPISEIPKLKLPRPGAEIAGDSEVKRLLLACWRGADEFRARMSSTVIAGKKNGGSAGNGGGMQKSHQRAEQTRVEPAKNKGDGER